MAAPARFKTRGGLAALKSYAQKYTKRKDLEAQVEKLKAECADLLPAVMTYFEKNGVDRQTLDGYTLAPRYELWAGRAEDMSQEDMYAALVEAGLHDFATESMNHQGMSAHIREIYRELVAAEQDKPKEKQHDVDLPMLYEEIWARYPELQDKLAIREDLKISVTKSKKSTARTRIKDAMTRKAQKAEELPKDVRDDRINY